MKLALINTETGKTEETRDVTNLTPQERHFVEQDMLKLCGEGEFKVEERE